MKKYLITVLMLVLTSLILTSCNHEHKYNDWVVKKEPTCTEKGEREGTCSCGDKSTLFISALEHSLDENNLCSSCGQRVFNLTTQEKNSCSKVFMYSNAQINHVVDNRSEEERFEFRFTLNDESEAMLDAPAFVDIKIFDSTKTNELYSNTFVVKSTDYESFLFENNTLKKLLATVVIPKKDIKASAYDHGYIAFRIYNSEFFDSDKFDLGEEPVLEIAKGLPECVHDFKTTPGTCIKCQRPCDHIFVADECEICTLPDPDKITINVSTTSGFQSLPTKEEPWTLSFEDNGTEGVILIEELMLTKTSKTSFLVYIKAMISEPDNGVNYATTIGYKLIDKDGVIVQSGILSNEISKAGEYFIIRGSLSSLTPSQTYSLKLLER